MKPLISVIVPVYKTERYLKKCVNSVLKSEFEGIEVILVDDGSPDKCPKICDEFAAQDSRVKAVHKLNGGLISARKAGLEIARGDYIAFADSDDYVEADMYLTAADLINKYSPDMILFDFYYEDEESGKKTESNQLFTREFYDRGALERELFPKMLYAGKYYKFGVNPCCWAKIFKKEILKSNLAPVNNRVTIGEDAAFVYPCLMSSNSVAASKKCVYHYIDNRGGMTSTYDKNLKDTFMLPFYRVREASAQYGVNISDQLDYYLVYLTNFLIRNEVNSPDLRSTLQGICESESIISAAMSVSTKEMPPHTAMLVRALRNRSVILLLFYARALKKFMK